MVTGQELCLLYSVLWNKFVNACRVSLFSLR
jgi:hypothetical protein